MTRTILYQFWDRDPPPDVSAMMDTWAGAEAFEYRRFDDTSALGFVEGNLGAAVADAYRQCAVPAMRADLFRYCALYVTGGVYADADTRNRGIEGLSKRGRRGLLFLRRQKVANDFMVVHNARDELMKYAVETAVENIERRISNNVWAVTGPGILTGLYQMSGPRRNALFDGFAIEPVKNIRPFVNFVWDSPYKQEPHHWTNRVKDGGSIFVPRGTA